MLALIYVVTIWCLATILYASVDRLETDRRLALALKLLILAVSAAATVRRLHVIAASASVAIGHAAMDAAIANYPDQRFTLRNGILVIRQHPRS